MLFRSLLEKIDRKATTITLFYEQNDNEIFHRTRLLNEMLSEVKTPVTVNYDIDVMLLPNVYMEARDKIIKEEYHLVYPFKKGDGQICIDYPHKENYNGENLFQERFYKPWGSLCGHVQFFNTEAYINGGRENEEFLSYGAEDRERMNRFIRFGYMVDWLEHQVYHLEHSRGINSSVYNPSFHANEALYDKLDNMETDQMIEYYQNVNYLKKYAKN